MAKADLRQKTARVLKFIMGLRHPGVANKMKAFGFTEKELNHGWDLMEAASRAVRFAEPTRKVDPTLVKKLDAFENLWFGIAKATLATNYPKVAAALFAKLAQKTGQEATLTVDAFLERLGEMERGEGRFAEEGVAARALLAKRGLTAEVIAEVQNVRAELRQLSEEDDTEASNEVSKEEAAVFEKELWDWYLEWGAIARLAVKDRRLLRGMGFLAGKKGRDSSHDEELELADEAAEGENGVAAE